MRYLKTYKIFETDGTFMYDPSIESILPEYIKVIKGDPKNPERLDYKKGVSRHLGPEVQIPYETMDKSGGRENPDTLEFDIYWDYNTNHKSLSINVEVNYGDLTACQFQIESPNKIKESPNLLPNTIFAIDDESLESFCNYINRWDKGIHINREDLKFISHNGNSLPS